MSRWAVALEAKHYKVKEMDKLKSKPSTFTPPPPRIPSTIMVQSFTEDYSASVVF